MGQSSLERRVGITILGSLALFVVFALLVAGLTFEPTFLVNVDFEDPSALKAGASVRLSGVKIGRVKDIALRPRDAHAGPAGKSLAMIRVSAEIEQRYRELIHDDCGIL